MPISLQITLDDLRKINPKLKSISLFTKSRKVKDKALSALSISILNHVRNYPMDISKRQITEKIRPDRIEIRNYGVLNKYQGAFITPKNKKFLTVPADFEKSIGRYRKTQRKVFKSKMKKGGLRVFVKKGKPIGLVDQRGQFVAWLKKKVIIKKDKKILPRLNSMANTLKLSLKESLRSFLREKSGLNG